MTRRCFVKGAAAVAMARPVLAMAQGVEPVKIFAYVGTYTSAVDGGANGEGIYRFEMNASNGELRNRRLVAKTPNPSWIVIHPSKKYLYAINEVNDFEGKNGSVTAFAIDRATGDLAALNTVSSGGAGPAHMSLDATGKFAFVANYAGGSIAVLPILADGRLGPPVDVHLDTDPAGPKRAMDGPRGSFAISGHDRPHGHMILPDPQGRFVLASDLAQDRIYVYRLDAATGKLTPADVPFASLPPGDGPRHFAFHPNGSWLYALMEEASTIVFFHYDAASGALHEQETISTLPLGFAGTNFTSEIQVSADGKFLYAANRLHDTIAVCAIDAIGRPRLIGETATQGDYPRYCGFSPGGGYLYACDQKSDCIVCYRVDRETGELIFTGQYTAVGSPAILTFLA